MPSLFILAGPNGTGKTTFYQTALNKIFLTPELPFVNVDLIVKDELGNYSTQNFLIAEDIYRQRISKLLKEQESFMIESNLAKSADYEWIEKMIQQGYEVILFFMCTDDINVNINRVSRRVKEGGHNIPVEIIIHRYKMGLMYLKPKIHLFKEIYFIDNTSDEAIQAAQIINGKLIEHQSTLPKWLDNLLFLFKKIGK